MSSFNFIFTASKMTETWIHLQASRYYGILFKWDGLPHAIAHAPVMRANWF